MHDRLGVLFGLWNAQHVYCAERNLRPWDLHCCVCSRGGYCVLCSGQYPDTGEDQMDSLGRGGQCFHSGFVTPCVDRLKTLTFAPVIIVIVAVGVQDRPTTAPQTGVWVSNYKLFNSPSFTQAISSVSTLIFAYAGTPGFFPIAEEMRDISRYGWSVLICQGAVTAMYIVTGCVIYYYCGSYVASPALGSAGTLVKKVAYGISLPGILMSTILLIHVS